MDALRTVAWLLAAAVFAGTADVLQVRLAIGRVGFVPLAELTQTVYLVAGLLSGLAVAVVRIVRTPTTSRPETVVATALLSWPTLVAVAYLNIVHLPSPSDPLTLAVNLSCLLIAGGLWHLLSRTTLCRRLYDRTFPVVLTVFVLSWTSTLFLATGSTGVAPLVEASPTKNAPDVIVVAIDTLRFDHSGLTTTTPAQTPNIRALAADGLGFLHAYAQASWTKPSVASLWTSLYPSSHRANFRRDRLGTKALTMPEVFASAGYRTAVFSANPWISPAFGFDQGVGGFFEAERESFVRLVLILRLLKQVDRRLPSRMIGDTLRAMETGFGVRDEKRSNCKRDEVIADLFRRWVENPTDRPLFAYLHLMSPHIPYLPPGREKEFPASEQVALLQRTDPLPPQRRRRLLDLYRGSVEHADEMIGRIVAVLKENNRYDKAIVVLTADHGEEFHEHGRWGHGKSLYDEVVRVPLIVKAPSLPRGTVTKAPVMLVDVLPTVAALANLPARPRWEGRDLRHLPERERPCFAELLREGGLKAAMLYRDGHKYIEMTRSLGGTNRGELYDLRTDPEEKRPLAVEDDAPWRALLAEVRDQARTKSLESSVTEIDEATRKRFEALGYVN